MFLIAAAFLSLFLLNSAFASIAATSSPNVTFSKPINLSNDSNQAHYPWVANVGDHVYVAWEEGDHGVYFRASSNGGSSWSPAVSSPGLKLSPPGGVSSYPIVYATGSNVYVVWSQAVNKVLQIFSASSANYGASFSSAVQLTSGSSPNGFITPVIAAAGSDVYVAYTAHGKNSYVVSSDKNGAAGSWSSPFHYSDTHEPQIAAEGSNAYAIADGVGIAVTNNGGTSWTIISSSTNDGDEPWVAASGQYVYVVSQTKTSSGNIHFFYSDNYGKPGSWTSEPGVDISGSIKDTWEPQLTVVGSYLYVAFHKLSSPITNYVVVSSNNGKTWSSPTDISGSTHLVGFATQVATSGCGGGYSCTGTPSSYVFTVWPVEMSSSNWQMYVSASSNYGTSWTAPPGIDVSNNPTGVAGPNNDIATSSIAANGSNAFVMWQQINSAGLSQVYFSYS
jgi:hypothetical protein